MADYCDACNELREKSPHYVANGVQKQECDSLKNNTGLDPTSGNDNCEDLGNILTCEVERPFQSADAYNFCDPKQVKDYIQTMFAGLINFNQAMVCNECGQWLALENMQKQIDCLKEAIKDLYQMEAGPTQLNFAFDGSGITWIGHSGTPAWAAGNNYQNTGTWAPVANTNESNYWIDANASALKGKFFMQYGGNGNGWASARFIDYMMTITRQVSNPDGSIDIDYVLDLGNFRGHSVGPGGIEVDYVIKVQNKTQWTFHGDTGDDFNRSPADSQVAGSAHIEAGGTYSGGLLDFYVSYPNGEFTPNTFKIGFAVKNPAIPLPDCLQ